MSARRIAWLSPYGPRSDIGAFTKCILPHLRGDDLECDLFVNANGPTYDSPVPTVDIPPGGAIGELLWQYDAAVFNLGNNVQNHGEIVAALRRTPGIAILHDYSYHHYFANKCFDKSNAAAAYAKLMRDVYGAAGFNMALRSGVVTRDVTFYAPWDGENVVDYPLTPPLASLAAAVVVHSRFMEEKVAAFFKGPILRLFLPSDQKTAPTDEDIARWRAETATLDHCRFATFGHIGRSKCLDAILTAMSQSPTLRARAHLTIAGHPGDKEYVRELEAMTSRLGLSRQVTFEFSVTAERLLAIKKEADVFLNLRYPNTEGASGSLVEMMNAGKPVIAYRSGCYAETPDGAALLIGRDGGSEAIVEAMEALASDPERRIAIGETARRRVAAQDSAAYANAFKSFVSDIAGPLRRRSRLWAPVRDGMAWRLDAVAPEDRPWFDDLTRARRSLAHLERDTTALSPEMFLRWPVDDLVSFVARVLLNAPVQGGLMLLLVDLLQRLGRWPFYRLISKVRLFQSLGEQKDIAKEDVAVFGERVADVAFWEVATRLHPEIFARMLYLCVLERNCAPGECENWTKRIAGGLLPSLVLLEFLASAEYRQNFPDGLMNDVEAWARRVGTPATDRYDQRVRASWPAETDIRFNDDDPVGEALLGQLWHRRDAQGRWSDGRTGDLRFLLPEEAVNGAVLKVRLRVAGTAITGKRRITAMSNRRELSVITISTDAPATWNIPIPADLYSKEGVSLLLMADQEFSPAAHGQSADRRSLGLMLIEARLCVAGGKTDSPSKDAANVLSIGQGRRA